MKKKIVTNLDNMRVILATRRATEETTTESTRRGGERLAMRVHAARSPAAGNNEPTPSALAGNTCVRLREPSVPPPPDRTEASEVA